VRLERTAMANFTVPRFRIASATLTLLLAGTRASIAQSHEAVPAWLAVDSAAGTVTLALQVAAAAGSPSALINGHRAGELQIVVPLNWTVKWEWRSVDSTSPHSLVVMAEREKLPAEGGSPAFTNAMTRMVKVGLPPGEADRTTFDADQAGWYWLLCGVPSHALNGEWLGLKVDPEAKTATVKQMSAK
jgi:hypothetical protein